MKLTPLAAIPDDFPAELLPWLKGAQLFDSSCSEEARVTFIARDAGYFLKRAPKGTLEREALLTRWFHKKKLAASVLGYSSDETYDWLLTEKIPGDDLTSMKYREHPKRLVDTLAECLRMLHGTDPMGCPVNHTLERLAQAEHSYQRGRHELRFAEPFGFTSAEEAHQYILRNGHLLQCDTLLHGDFCLPNIILDDWRFRGFIDLDSGGAGDRHWDIYWAVWTLQLNLHTNQYRERFLDAYGRSLIDDGLLRLCAAIVAM